MTAAESQELAELLSGPPELAMPSELAIAPKTCELDNFPDGFHYGLSPALYHSRSLSIASNSGATELVRSAAHFEAWCKGLRDKEGAALNLGTAVHMALLEPRRFAETYVIAPNFGDCRKRDNKLARDAWRKEHASATILSADDGAKTLGMIASLARRRKVQKLLERAETEVTLLWTDKETGVRCKARVDVWARAMVLSADLKSAQDARPSAFERAIETYGYHRQSAFYQRGFAALGEPVEGLVFVVVESEPPHEAMLYPIDDEDVKQGDKEIGEALRALARALESGQFPGYSDDVVTACRPQWARNRDQ